MAVKTPLVITNGQIEQLQAGDTLSNIGSASVSIGDTPPADNAALWFDTGKYNAGQTAMYVLVAGTYRRIGDYRYYPTPLQCMKIDLALGRSALSRTRIKSSKIYRSNAFV